MRIVVVHPYPVSSKAVGGVTRVYELVRFLAPRHAVSVLAFTSTDGADRDAQAIADLAQLGVDQHLFARPSPKFRQKAGWWLDGATPYYVNRNRSHLLETALREMDMRESIDVVHLELGYLALLLGSLGGRAARVLCEQETMSLAIERLTRVPFRERTWYERAALMTLPKVRAFEAATLPTFDALYGITSSESARLSERVGFEVPVLPHVVDARRFSASPHKPDQHRLLFLGNFAHHPNVHAILWFVANVWPAIRRQVPDVQLDAVGPGLPSGTAGLLDRAGITVRGYVTNLPACYAEAAIVINPIQSGGGMRGKVLEAFASGRAVVSTPMGMEGIDAVSGRDFLAASSPEEFAGSVVQYLGDHGLRQAHGSNARTLVAQKYDAPAVFARLEGDYQNVVEIRRSVRANA